MSSTGDFDLRAPAHEGEELFKVLAGEEDAGFGEGAGIAVRKEDKDLKQQFNKALAEITAGLAQDYRMHRMKNGWRGQPPARSTLHQEIVCLRQVLKYGQRHGWIESVPNLTPPYKTSGKITHRAWFSPEEYKMLYEATRERRSSASSSRKRLAVAT